ncbi:MAG: tripartite tricarboxylate transporter TctB family protein, partial [Gammaproteobacteria bacterium]|nr:tripartite tricarboxylate transporter TctB family protein [Gammaproteobacteria bacterium]
PNTMPMALSILGVIIATVLLVVPKAEQPNGDMPAAEIDVSRLKDYKLGQAIAMIAAMLAYALLLRPLGFIPATIFFLVGCSWILGERRYSLMVSVAVIGTLSIWYLVQEVLGVYLKPLPALLS